MPRVIGLPPCGIYFTVEDRFILNQVQTCALRERVLIGEFGFCVGGFSVLFVPAWLQSSAVRPLMLMRSIPRCRPPMADCR